MMIKIGDIKRSELNSPIMREQLFKPFLTRDFVDPPMTENIAELRKERDYWLDMFKRRRNEIEKLRTRKTMVQIKKVKLGPKDTLVIQAPGMITDDTVKRLVKYAKKCGIKMLVMADGLKVKRIIRK